MTISRQEALARMETWTTEPSLRNHARAVEVVMRRAAFQYGRGGQDEAVWGAVGLLHDADYQLWPDEHPDRIVAWLKERGEQDMAHAIAAHNVARGPQPATPMAKALLACDELAGFIVACSLVRPDGVLTLKPKSVKKKLKDKRFAAKVSRQEIRQGAELLGVELGQHIQFVIDAMAPFADELGIAGQGAG